MRLRLVIKQAARELSIGPGDFLELAGPHDDCIDARVWLATHGRFMRDHVLPELLANFEGKDIRKEAVRAEVCKFVAWLVKRYVGDAAFVTFPTPEKPDKKFFEERERQPVLTPSTCRPEPPFTRRR